MNERDYLPIWHAAKQLAVGTIVAPSEGTGGRPGRICGENRSHYEIESPSGTRCQVAKAELEAVNLDVNLLNARHLFRDPQHRSVVQFAQDYDAYGLDEACTRLELRRTEKKEREWARWLDLHLWAAETSDVSFPTPSLKGKATPVEQDRLRTLRQVEREEAWRAGVAQAERERTAQRELDIHNETLRLERESARRREIARLDDYRERFKAFLSNGKEGMIERVNAARVARDEGETKYCGFDIHEIIAVLETRLTALGTPQGYQWAPWED